MKLLFLGDIVGRAAREAAVAALPDWRRRLGLDFVVVNGENAAGGFGITAEIAEALFDAGVDVITTGNHVWDQRGTTGWIGGEPRVLRPVNYPPGTPGRGFGIYEAPRGRKVAVINAMGRVFMNPLDNPFAAVDGLLGKYRLGSAADCILVDFHGEATSEKTAMGCFCDGRASLVIGTHSHVPTADARILPKGTAFQTDAGMCGDYDSIIGMDKAEPLQRFTRQIPTGRFTPAQGEPTLCGVLVDCGRDGRATAIHPIRAGGGLAPAWPGEA